MRSSDTDPARSPDVLVVGGGVIGLATAWRLAGRGASVTVADPDPGRSASWAAAGMLAPVTEVHPGEERLLHLNLASAGLYPDFVAELEASTGADVGYRRSGTLIVARDNDDHAALNDLYRYQVQLGLEVQRVSAREARRLEPALSPRTRSGVHVPGDHQIDNRALVGALVDACTRNGVGFVRSSVLELEVGPGARPRAMLAGDEKRISAPSVVLAAGAATTRIGGLEEAGLPPIRPVKGQLIHLRGPEPLLGGNVRGLEAYLVGRADGRVVIGATVEELGFDLRITAGAVHELLRAAYELVPGITELEVVETTAGSRPATPDNAPVIGPTELPGVVVATGHYRNGVLLAPVTAAAVAELVLNDRLDDVVAPFGPDRFAREGSLR